MEAITYKSIPIFVQEVTEQGRGGKINYWLGCSINPNLCYISTLKFFNATHLNLYLRGQLEEITVMSFTCQQKQNYLPQEDVFVEKFSSTFVLLVCLCEGQEPRHSI